MSHCENLNCFNGQHPNILGMRTSIWHCFYQLGLRFLICERFLGQFPSDIVVAGADRVAGVRGGGAVGVARVTRVPPGVTVSRSSVRHAIRSEEMSQF